MPLNPDGTMTTEMPSIAELTGTQAQNSATGQQTRGGRSPNFRVPTERAEKPQYQSFTPTSFPDFARAQAKIDKAPTLADDDRIMDYAKRYAEEYLPGVILANHGLENKNYLASVKHDFLIKTSNKLDKLKNYFKSQEGMTSDQPPPGITAGDWAKYLAGKTGKGAGESLAGVTRSLGAPLESQLRPVFGFAAPYVAEGLKKLPFGLGERVSSGEEAMGTSANALANSINQAITEPSENLSNQTSPAFQQATSHPLLSKEGFNLPNAVAAITGGVAESLPQAGAAYLTKGASLVPGFAAQTAEASRRQEISRVMAIPDEQLATLPPVQEMMKKGIPLPIARGLLAQQSADAAYKAGAVQGAAMGAIPELSALKGVTGTLPQRVLQNLKTQTPLFGAGAVAGQAGTTLATNPVTGESRNPLEGGLETAARGAIQSLPFLGMGSKPGAAASPVEPMATAATEKPSAEVVQEPQTNGARPQSIINDAVKQAFSDVPAPPAESLKDPGYAKTAYQQWLDSARAELEGVHDLTERQVDAIEPNLRQMWAQNAKVDPAILETATEAPATQSAAPETPTTAPVEDALPNFSQRTEEVAPVTSGEVREAATGDTAVKDRIAEEVKQTLGREPTPEETAQLTQQVTDELATQQGVNALLPKAVREEAVNQLVARKKTLPTPEEINDLAAKLSKEIESNKENVLLKKKSQEEPTYSAKDDISIEPTGRSIDDVREALAAKMGEKAAKALESSGLLKLVQSKADLPEAYRGEGTISGVYTPERRAYLVADHIKPGAEWRTLVHEAGVHYGMRSMLPDPLYRSIEEHIQDQLGKDTPEGKEVTAAWNSAEAAGTNPIIQTNETIAHMVQSRLAQVPGSMWNRALTAIKAFAYDKIGQYLPKSVAKKLLDNATITQLAKSATGRAAELRAQDVKARAADLRDLEIPAYSRTKEELRKTIEANTAEKVADAIQIREKPPEEVSSETEKLNSLSSAEEKATKIFNDLLPLKFLNEKLAKKGISVDRDANMFDEATRLQAKSSHAATIAEEKYVEPTINWLIGKAKQMGVDPVKFTNELSNWYQGKRSLEVNERADLEDSKLTPEASAQRKALKQDWMEGKLPDGQYIQKLRDIVNRAGARLKDEETLPASGITNKAANVLVAKARKAGITPEVIQGFEPYRQSMVDAISENGLKSKRFSTYDEARKSGLGSQYYVPLKGFAEGQGEGVDFQGPRTSAFTREYQAVEGRDTISQNPLLSLMQDVIRSAKDVPENEFTRVILNFGKKHGEDTGIQVKSVNMEKAMRDAVASGKSMTDIANQYKKANTVIHNAGNYRFFINFPEKSAVAKAIKGINASESVSGKFHEFAKKITNGQGRLATVARPAFLLWNMGWNDFFGNFSQVAGDYGLPAAMDFAKNYWGQGGWVAPKAWSYYLKGKNALAREALTKDPNASEFAKDMQKFVEYGGDLSFDQRLNATKSIYDLNAKLKEATGPLATAKQKFDAGLDYLQKAGDVSNMVGRVAAYRTYVKRATREMEKQAGRKLTGEEVAGIEKDGVLYARRLLDFLQSGTWGKALNSHFMFARVALTQAERISNTFRNADGSWNYKKMALVLGASNMASAIGYALLAQVDPDIRKQDDDTVASKFLIPTGDKPVAIPMGYGLSRLMLVPGIMAARVALGHSDVKNAVKTVARTYMENLTPFKPTSTTPGESTASQIVDLLEAGTPTYIRPLVQLGRNKNVFGSPISKESSFVDPNAFRSDSPRTGTPEGWTWLAKTMREVSGGTVDVFPESLEFLLGSYFTGPANDLMRASAAIGRKSEGLDVEPQKLPFAPTIFSNDEDYYEQRRLKELRDSLVDDSKAMNYAKKQGDKAVSELKRSSPNIEKNLILMKDIDKASKDFSKQRKDIESNKLISPSVKEERIKRLTEIFKHTAEQITQRAGGIR